jgi:hypothetical protein
MEKKTSDAQLRAVKKYKEKYKEKVNRISLDFYPTEQDLWDHVQTQEKKQTYIKSLIRQDMCKKP